MWDIPRLVDDAIAFAKSEGLDAAWTRWCELAYETSGQQEGLSKEESGRELLARCGRSFLLVSDGGAEGRRVPVFRDTLEKRILEAVDSKKYVLKAPSGEPISPDLITSWSLGREFPLSPFDFGTGDIVLIDGTRVPRARLVRAEPVAPAKTHTKTTNKQVIEEVVRAVLDAVMADGEKLPNDNEIIEPVNDRLEHFTIRLTISGAGEVCRTLTWGELREARAYDRPQALD
jgi:hypothetical protein